MHRLPNRPFRRLEIDDGAALEADRALMADADDARDVRAAGQCRETLDRFQLRDEADYLAGADVENGQRRAFARRERLEPRHQAMRMRAHVSTPLPRAGFFLRKSSRSAIDSSVSLTTTRSLMRR